jgi:hypothetical protein
VLNPAVKRARVIGRHDDVQTSIYAGGEGSGWLYYDITFRNSFDFGGSWGYTRMRLFRTGWPGRLRLVPAKYGVRERDWQCRMKSFSGADDLTNKVAGYKAWFEKRNAYLRQKEQARKDRIKEAEANPRF